MLREAGIADYEVVITGELEDSLSCDAVAGDAARASWLAAAGVGVDLGAGHVRLCGDVSYDVDVVGA